MLHLSRKMRFLPYLLILPALLLLFVFKLYPIIITLRESFIGKNGLTLKNFQLLFKDSIFWNSLMVTLKMNIVIIPLQIFIALIFALLVNAPIRGIGIFRTIFYLPITISATVSCLVWNVMLNPNSGVVNSFLNYIGIGAQDFFLDKNQALWCIVLVASWIGCGYWMMFILAGLKNIDPVLYEAAMVDGSGWLHTTLTITLPLLKNVLLFVFVANTTSNILLFVPMQLITNGGPQGSTDVLMFEAYLSAFKYYDRSRSSAIVLVLLVLIIIICAFQAKMLNEKSDRGTGKA